MAADVRVVVNRRGVRALLDEPKLAADLEARARRIATAAGEGMRVEAEPGGNGSRPRAAVITDTWRARRSQAKSQALIRAVDAGRG